MSILSKFPLPTPRKLQVEVMDRIESAFSEGIRYVIVEAPVGSGKSAMAIAAALYYGDSHILTPRKNLQDQYYEDFHEHINLMKGRSSYPCVYKDASQYSKIKAAIKKGDTPSPSITGISVAEGACSNGDTKLYEACNSRHTCPYVIALDTAIGNPHVVHNVHSFIFQAFMHSKFDKRGISIVDEAHNLEDICREFITKDITIPGKAGVDYELPVYETVGEYEEFLLQDKFIPRRVDARDLYKQAVETLMLSGLKDFVVDFALDDFFNRTTIKFVPKSIYGVPESLIFSFGERVLLMSGTIYDREAFCRTLGIPVEQSCYIQVPSTFHPSRRPVIMKSEYMVDTSHARWNENLPELIRIIKLVMSRFPNVKGLIHTPSYYANSQILKELSNEPRLTTHQQHDFRQRLEEFYETKEPKIFMSPICQEGVDFKGDRARFQMILRVPYPSIGDRFIKSMMQDNFSWYNRRALIVFGQQIGRINRSDEDHGVTILVDSRFPKFVSSNKKRLPKWLLDAFVTN